MALFTSSKIQTVSPAKRVQGEIQLPGDKSISHRLAVLGAIAEGPTEIHFFSPSADCASTLECLKALGVRVERHSESSFCNRDMGLFLQRKTARVQQPRRHRIEVIEKRDIRARG